MGQNTRLVSFLSSGEYRLALFSVDAGAQQDKSSRIANKGVGSFASQSADDCNVRADTSKTPQAKVTSNAASSLFNLRQADNRFGGLLHVAVSRKHGCDRRQHR